MEFNLSDMLFAVVNFAVMAFILTRLLYKPVFRMLDQRKEQTQALQAGAGSDREAASAELEAARQALLDARREARSILEEARRAGASERDALVADGKAAAKALAGQARAEIAHEREAAREELREEVALLSLELTRRLVTRTIDADEDARLVRRFLEALDDHGTRAALRAAGGQAPVIHTAKPLSQGQMDALTRKLGEILGDAISPCFLTDPSVLGGLSLQLDDFLMDESLSGQIGRLQQEWVG